MLPSPPPPPGARLETENRIHIKIRKVKFVLSVDLMNDKLNYGKIITNPIMCYSLINSVLRRTCSKQACVFVPENFGMKKCFLILIGLY